MTKTKPSKSKTTPKVTLPILAFETAKEWERWLSTNHDRLEGVWLCFQKKSSDRKSPSYAEALDVALCYGWIDGQVKSKDNKSWIHKFTPRRPRSSWSKKNTEHAVRLMQEGKMQPSGLAEIEAAKEDGRWDAAYDSPKNATIPDDFLKELSRNKKAQAFFDSLNKTNRYAIAYRLQTAKKPETRARRMKVILEMLARGENFH